MKVEIRWKLPSIFTESLAKENPGLFYFKSVFLCLGFFIYCIYISFSFHFSLLFPFIFKAFQFYHAAFKKRIICEFTCARKLVGSSNFGHMVVYHLLNCITGNSMSSHPTHVTHHLRFFWNSYQWLTLVWVYKIQVFSLIRFILFDLWSVKDEPFRPLPSGQKLCFCLAAFPKL